MQGPLICNGQGYFACTPFSSGTHRCQLWGPSVCVRLLKLSSDDGCTYRCRAMEAASAGSKLEEARKELKEGLQSIADILSCPVCLE